MKNKTKLVPIIFFVFVFSALLWRLWQLSFVPLHDWDESIYARVAWESVQNSSLEMTYNGEVWLEKPPLVVYVLAIVMMIFGQSELWLRGASLLFGFPLLICLYLLAKKLILASIERHKRNSNHWELSPLQLELTSILPVAALLSAPLFVDRMTLVNYDIPLALGWVLFFLADSFKWKLIALIIGVSSKSLLGFFPLAFELFKIDILQVSSKKYWEKLVTFPRFKMYALLILIPLIWHFISLAIYGNDFVQQHLLDHLVKRVTTPIELHFGGRLFYIKQIYLEFQLFAIVLASGYAIWLFDGLLFLIKNRKLPAYLFILFGAPLVYLAFLTFSSTKIWWYILAALPLVSLIVSYLALRLPTILRYALIIGVFTFFLYRFVPETFSFTPSQGIGGAYIPPAKTRLAFCLRDQPGKTVAFLVDDGERKVKNIFEAANIGIGSSFIYGGSPAFVYHSQKDVTFFYDPTEFTKQRSQYDFSVLNRADADTLKIGIDKPDCYQDDWLAM